MVKSWEQMSVFPVLSEIAINLGLLFACLVGPYLAWNWVAASTRQADAALAQADIVRRHHVAELFNRAVGQLNDAKLEVRLGAVYMLRQIAKDFLDLARDAYHAVDADMTQGKRDQYNFRLDLHGAYLRGTRISNANLEGANLSGADFTEANFCGSDFTGTNLTGTILRGADLTDATNLTAEQIAAAITDDRTKLPVLAPEPAAAK
jgi:uncharacterized protein YjbI with pentapeptide repeats